MARSTGIGSLHLRRPAMPAFWMAGRTLLGLSLLLCSVIDANSRGGGARDDPWNPDHIAALPAEIRQYIATVCKGPPAAQRDFATYAPQEKRWRINLEYLRCDGLESYRHGNQCLDVDFVQAGSHFRLARKEYRNCDF